MRLVGLVGMLAIVIVGLSGCGARQPFDPPVAGDIPAGPGVFTGADGAWVIYGAGGD